MLAEVPNRLTLEGHTDATPFSGGERGYSNWELSADRANASRRELLAGGLPDDRVLRVQGLASSQLMVRDKPDDPTNRRISIVVMTREAEDAIFRPQSTPQADAEPSIKPEKPTLQSPVPKSTACRADQIQHSTAPPDQYPSRRQERSP